MGDEVARAERRLARAEQSARLNPRAREIAQVQPRLRSALTALEHGQIGLRNLSRTLLDRTYYLPQDMADQAYPPAVREALADVLDAVATAVHAVAPVAGGHHPDDTAAIDAVATHLSEVGRRTEHLGTLLYIDPHADPAAWQQHGALLAAIDRLRVEIDAAIRPPVSTWRPAGLGGRQRDALHRGLTAARDHGCSRPHRTLRERLGIATTAPRPQDDAPRQLANTGEVN
jgi:hypothetical protein